MVRPAKAHRRTAAARHAPTADKLAHAWRSEFQLRAGAAVEWTAHDVAVEAACDVARFQAEFEALVERVEALLLGE